MHTIHMRNTGDDPFLPLPPPDILGGGGCWKETEDPTGARRGRSGVLCECVFLFPTEADNTLSKDHFYYYCMQTHVRLLIVRSHDVWYWREMSGVKDKRPRTARVSVKSSCVWVQRDTHKKKNQMLIKNIHRWIFFIDFSLYQGCRWSMNSRTLTSHFRFQGENIKSHRVHQEKKPKMWFLLVQKRKRKSVTLTVRKWRHVLHCCWWMTLPTVFFFFPLVPQLITHWTKCFL